MKKIYLLSFVLIICSQFIYAQQSTNILNIENPQAKEGVEWKNKVVDMGELEQRVPATAIFEFTNIGEKPVIITNVKTSCGCTNPKYPKEPIQPGHTAQVSAVYNAASPGNFTKTLTVYLNIQNGTHILKLTGKVLPKQEQTE